MKDNYLLSTTRSFISRLPVSVVALCVLFINLAGYTGFRYFISNDIFGGDTVNTVIARMDSYTFKHSNLISDPSLFYAMILSGKKGNPDDNINAFVYDLLSPQGREALERLARDPANKRDKEIFLFEFNRSVIDKKINWPKSFDIKESLREPNLTKAGKLYYNLQVLSWLYPNNIRDSLHPLFQWKYDLLSLVKTIPKISFGYFTINTPTRYAPLTSIYTAGVQMFLQNSPERIIIAIVLTGIIYATLMLFVFLLSVKLIKSIPWALVAVFLFQSAVSTILISYQLFSLPYLFVPLVMVAAIYTYLQYKDSGGIGWLILFFYLTIIAPWFREFPGAIPFIVFASEVLSFKGRRSLVILLVCIPLMIHSVYPSLFPWFIGLNKGGVYNVFAQENVQHITSHGALNWHFGGFLFVQFPPILWIVMLVSIGYWLWRSRFVLWERGLQLSIFEKSISLNILKFRMTRVIMGLLTTLFLIVFLYGLNYYLFIANRVLEKYPNFEQGAVGAFLFILIVFVALVSFRFNTILTVYLLVSFTPFLRIALAELHLSFTMIPLAIIFTLWIKDLFSSISTNIEWKKKKAALALLSVLFGMGLIDQFLNIPASYWVQNRMVETNKSMAIWLKNNTPRHSIVVTNFYNFTDVFYYSDYHFDPYETVENCPMGPTQVVHKNKDFENLLNKNFGVRDIYLIAAEHEFLNKGAKEYHSHKYVKKPPGEVQKLSEFSAKSIYYYIDPLKYFVPHYFISFIGYMDWSTDFYYNNELSMFKRVVDANYTLYKLKDISKGFAVEPQSGSPPRLVDSYKGYNIVDYNKQFYGVPQSMGTLDLSKKEDRGREGILVGKDRKEIEQLIDKAIKSQTKVKATNLLPQLVGAYKGYNIVDYNNQFYGVPQSMGPLDLSEEGDRNKKGILVSKDRKEIERLIDIRTEGGSDVCFGKLKIYSLGNNILF